jgi:hypothetical protein
MLGWEVACLRASHRATSELSQLAISEKSTYQEWQQDWRLEFLKILRSMAEAEAETALDPTTCVSSLFRCVTAVHADRLEHLAAQEENEWDEHAKAIFELQAGCKNDTTIARINTMLHLDQSGGSGLRPGNIYRMTAGLKKGLGLQGVQYYSDFLENPDDQKLKELSEQRLCCPVLVEVTPACDHAQGNVRMPRCIAGVVVRNELRNKVKMKKRAGFLWTLGPLYLSKGVKDGVYYIHINSRYVLGIVPSILGKHVAFLRLRSQALSDLQSWLGYQSTRLGKVLLST